MNVPDVEEPDGVFLDLVEARIPAVFLDSKEEERAESHRPDDDHDAKDQGSRSKVRDREEEDQGYRRVGEATDQIKVLFGLVQLRVNVGNSLDDECSADHENEERKPSDLRAVLATCGGDKSAEEERNEYCGQCLLVHSVFPFLKVGR